MLFGKLSNFSKYSAPMLADRGRRGIPLFLISKEKAPVCRLADDAFSFGSATENRTPIWWMRTTCPNH